MLKLFSIAFAVSFLAALGAPVGATDLTATFRDPESGKLIPDVLSPEKTRKCEDQDGPCLTLGSAMFHALLRPFPDEQQMDPAKLTELKFRRGALAYRILDKKSVGLSPADVSMAKDTIGRVYSPVIVVQAFRLLDPTLKDEGAAEPEKK